LSALSSLDEARSLYLARGEEAAAPAAAHLRAAAEALGSVTGRTYTEELLDAVFSRFCVGK
jgi:tRNA modification GTPase